MDQIWKLYIKYLFESEKILFLLAGHKVDFIVSSGAKNQFFHPLVEKKSCATPEKY